MFSPTSYLIVRGCTYRLLISCWCRASCACAEYTKPTGPGSAKPLTVDPFMKTPDSGQLNNNLHISFRKLLQYDCHDLLYQVWAGLSRMQSLCVHKNPTGIITIQPAGTAAAVIIGLMSYCYLPITTSMMSHSVTCLEKFFTCCILQQLHFDLRLWREFQISISNWRKGQ